MFDLRCGGINDSKMTYSVAKMVGFFFFLKEYGGVFINDQYFKL